MWYDAVEMFLSQEPSRLQRELELGDVAGHPFRGNQYAEAKAADEDEKKLAKRYEGKPDVVTEDAVNATNDADDEGTHKSHAFAARMNRVAAKELRSYLDNDLPDAPKVPRGVTEDEGYKPLEDWHDHKRDIEHSIKAHNDDAARHESEAARLRGGK